MSIAILKIISQLPFFNNLFCTKVPNYFFLTLLNMYPIKIINALVNTLP